MKPWNKLREIPEGKPPMVPGAFYCKDDNVLLVEIHRIQNREALLSIGAGSSDFGVQVYTARVLSGFFAELADQLEGA